MLANRLPKILIFFIFILLFYMFITLSSNYFSFAEEELVTGSKLEQGKAIFKNCSGCHLNGQNLIKKEKPIIGSQKLKTQDSFKEFISSPPPPMPKFQKIADDPQKLEALYAYVRSLKKQD